jgi:polyhydroxyalkanoate synthesis regulator phasin
MDLSLKRLLLAGIGTAAYSYEKGMAIVEELVKKGELTVNQGKELNEELKKKATDKASETISASALRDILASLNLATKEDLTEIKSRLENLENK